MISVWFFKILRFLPLLGLPFLAWLLPHAEQGGPTNLSSDKVNLALRRTADGLLRASGDSTSRIPAIERSGELGWRIRLEQPFSYERLPALLQSSLELHGIHRPYEVAVRRCVDETIDLGYHQSDYLQDSVVPCGGRDMPEDCHFIEVAFLENDGGRLLGLWQYGAVLLVLGGIAGYWFFRRLHPTLAPIPPTAQTDWLEFGNSRLDMAGQILFCGGGRQTLTFREAKLLRLFVTHPDRLLEREYILQQVWADEGVLVGRSVDVFVSRLRKKIAADHSIGIVAVHGVGYRLETGREG